MKLNLDGYTKFILTVIAIALLLNAFATFAHLAANSGIVHAKSENEMRITDVRSTWPIKIEISNWPSEYKVKK